VNDFAIARYKADGSLDTTFGGSGGYTRLEFGGDDSGYAIAPVSGGGFVVAGTGAAATTSTAAPTP
jgi:hypothetical protein